MSVIQTKNKGGRPRSQEPGTRLTTWVPVRQFENIRVIAAKSGVSMSKLVRRLLENQPQH